MLVSVSVCLRVHVYVFRSLACNTTNTNAAANIAHIVTQFSLFAAQFAVLSVITNTYSIVVSAVQYIASVVQSTATLSFCSDTEKHFSLINFIFLSQENLSFNRKYFSIFSFFPTTSKSQQFEYGIFIRIFSISIHHV